MKKHEFAPRKDKAYPRETISKNDQTGKNKNIQRYSSDPSPNPEYAHIPRAEVITVIELHDNIANQETAEDKEEADLVPVWYKDKTMWKIIGDDMERMLLHDSQDTYGTHDIQAKCATCGIEIDPEYVYDASQVHDLNTGLPQASLKISQFENGIQPDYNLYSSSFAKTNQISTFSNRLAAQVISFRLSECPQTSYRQCRAEA